MHPGLADRPCARRRQRLLPVASAAAGARPHHRGRIRQPVRQVRRVQRRPRHRRRLQPAEARTGPSSCRCPGDVGSQYTPAAGWAQAITYHRDVLKDRSWRGAIAVVLGGEASVATNGFWSCLTMATTLKLPMLFYIEDNGLGISVRGDMQTPGGNIAANLASFGNLFVRDGDGTDPRQSRRAGGRSRRPRARAATARRCSASPCRASRATPGRTTRRATAATPRSRRTGSAIPCRSCKSYLVPAAFSRIGVGRAGARGRARRAHRRSRPRARARCTGPVARAPVRLRGIGRATSRDRRDASGRTAAPCAATSPRRNPASCCVSPRPCAARSITNSP